MKGAGEVQRKGKSGVGKGPKNEVGMGRGVAEWEGRRKAPA